MSETLLGAAATKYGLPIAGFVGSLVALSYVRSLPTMAMFTAVGVGTATAHYLTPLVWLFLPTTVGNVGIGFLIGLLSMNLIPGLLKLSEDFSKAPLRFLQRIFKR